MKIAVDAMGGDYSPGVVVQGAAEAASQLGIHITLVGNKQVIAPELRSYASTEHHITIHHCEEVVCMDESPLKAVRQKKEASIAVAFNLVKMGRVDAVVSAGHSGATLAAGALILGRLQGVERPAIAGIIPGQRGHVILIDAGANVDCRPSHLFQFALMAHAFANCCMGMGDPKIGLLNIGEEEGKGNEQVRSTQNLLSQSRLNFVGNVQGSDIITGDVQIIVCDGFVGNVALKLGEKMAGSMCGWLKRELNCSFWGKIARLLARGAFENFEKELDYEEYGGAPLLGINGVGIVCHGGSSAKAIKNAIGMAVQYVNNRVLEKMVSELRMQGERTLGNVMTLGAETTSEPWDSHLSPQ